MAHVAARDTSDLDGAFEDSGGGAFHDDGGGGVAVPGAGYDAAKDVDVDLFRCVTV